MLRELALLLALCAPAEALLVQPRLAVLPRVSPRNAMPRMQFGDPGQRPTRDNEPEEFFKTNMDDMSDEEKLKSPVVIGGLALLVAPFIVGAIALAYYR